MNQNKIEEIFLWETVEPPAGFIMSSSNYNEREIGVNATFGDTDKDK